MAILAGTTTEDDAASAGRRRRVGAWLVAANLLAAVVVAMLLATMQTESHTLHRQQALGTAEGLASTLAAALEAELQPVDLALRLLRRAAEEGRAQGVAVDDLRRTVPQASGLRVVYADVLDPALRQALAAADGADRLLIAGPRQEIGVDGDRWVLDLARALRSGPDMPAMVAVASLDTARIESLLSAVVLDESNALSVRMDDHGLVARIVGGRPSREQIGQPDASPAFLAAMSAAPAAGQYVSDSSFDRVERAVAYRQVADGRLRVMVGIATPSGLDRWREGAGFATAMALLALATLVATSLIGFRVWRRDDARRLALDLERQQLKALLTTGSDALHVLDRNGHLVEFSDSFAHMLGLSRQDLQGRHVTHWDRRYAASEIDRLLRSFAIGQRLSFSTVVAGSASRPPVEVEVKGTGVRIGRRDLLFLSARDITQRNRSLAALKASAALLERTERIAGAGGWELAFPSGPLQLTSQARRLLEFDDTQAVGLRACLRVFAGAARRQLWQAVLTTRLTGRSWDLELAARTARGRPLWLRCTAEPVGDGNAPEGVAGVLRDVTERRARTVELQREHKLRLQLERQSREQERMLDERGEMLDVLAHEVRQPLNNASAAMQSALSTLRDVGEQSAAPRLARAQAVLGQVMARLDNTLAVAALLARQGPIQREDTDLDILLAVAIADMAATERPRIVVQRDTAARTVSIDMSLMRLALRNLLSNALKYSRPGTQVTVRISDSDEPLGLVIDVIDQGTGIEPGLRGHLFERGARGRHTPGAEHGLGLYIVRRVMELHRGQALMQATGDSGTTMRLLVADVPDE